MKRMILIFTRIFLMSYVGLCLVLYFYQRSFIYFPVKATGDLPANISVLPVNGAKLRISVRECDGPDALVYFGGNGEDVSRALPLFSKAFPDHSIYLMHYRGYGGSSGKPMERALHEDAQALYDMVVTKHRSVVVVGRSLGTGIAARLASANPVARLVLVTPYDSILNIAKKQFPFMPVGLLLQDKFETWRCIPYITAPTMVIAAKEDEVIPAWSTAALLKRFRPGILRVTEIEGVGHNSISESPNYVIALQGVHTGGER